METSTTQRLERGLLDGLEGRNDLRVATTPHLYDLPPEGQCLEAFRLQEDDLIVGAWLNPRAAFWLLDANGIRGRMGRSPLLPDENVEDDAPAKPPRTIWCFDFRKQNEPQRVLEEIERILAERGDRPVETAAEALETRLVELTEPTRARWYPVIDRGRCSSCLECLNFCLFGVYGIDRRGRLFVETPDACKDGCPACSRICPHGAIMFPAHHDPTIAGDGAPETGQPSSDLVQLFGGKPAPDDLDGLVDELDEADL